MTKKHKLRKSKHLLENKKDVDDNVENILRMIGEESESAENEPSFKKSKLSSLVKGFHEDYEHLHKHYKQLISKLENVGHSASGSDSSDSDAEGDRSENDVPKTKVDALREENGWKQKLVEDLQGKEQSLEAEIEKLKQSTEEQAKEISDLKELLDKAIKDKEATRVELSSDYENLSSENENLKLLVETAEREAGESHKTIALMEDEIRTLSIEKEVIEKERDDLKISIVDLENKKEDLRNQLQDTIEKCTFLSSQLEKAQLAEKEVQTLLSEIEKMKNGNFMLSRENDNLKVYEQNLDAECSQLKATIAETKAENNTLTEEKHLLESKLQLLGAEIDGMIVEKEELMNNMNIERGATAEEKERLVSEHCKCLSELEKAHSSVKELESTNGALNNKIAVLQEEKNSLASELQQLEASSKNLGNDLEQELECISVMQKNNKDLELANSNLQNELAMVRGQKNEAVASTVELGNKLEEQSQQISNLQEAIENLEAAKTNMYNEVTVHQEEKNAALLQVQQLEAYIKNLESELEQKQSQVLATQKANEELLEQNSSLERQLEEARSKLRDEIIVLQREKERVLDNLQQSSTSIKTIEEGLEKQREQNSILQLANEDLHKSIANLEKELEDTKGSSHAEILALEEQKNRALSDLQQSEISIKNLRMDLEQRQEEISILHQSNEDMKDNNDRLNQQLEETRTSMHAEIAALREEKDAAQVELQQSLASARNLETVLEKQTKNLSDLQQANDDLKKNNCTLTEQFEVIKIELQEEVKMAHEEKDATLTQLEKSEDSIKNLESEMAQLKEELSIQMENNSSLNRQLEEAILKVSNLNEELEMVQVETASKINDMNTNTKDLEKTIDLLSSQKTKVEENLGSELEQKQNQVLAIQKANEKLLEQNSSLERQLEEARSKLQDEIIVLQRAKERVLDNLQQSSTSIKTLEEGLEKQREQNSILQLANEDLHKSIANLEKELEDTKGSSHAEILALEEQKNRALSDLQQSEISIKNLRMDLEQRQEEISILHQSNEDMKDNNDRLNQQLEETRTSMHAEIAALREEKDAAQVELQQSLASARNLETVLEKQMKNLSAVQQANDDLKKNNCTLTEQFEVIKIELQEEVKMAHEEKDATLTQLEKSEDSIKNLESEMAQLKEELSIQMENNSSLNKQLEEAILKLSNLNEELEMLQVETASKINDMNTNTKDLEKTIDLLSSQKTKVEENMKIITEACMEKLSFMKDFEDQVKQKIADREIAIVGLQQSLRGILGSCQRLQYAHGEVSTRALHLEVLSRNHIEQIGKLNDKYTEILEKRRHLEEENICANKENRKLQNHVQELEAQLQLAKQKLRVTEAESKSKEDSYVMAVETSHREIQYLEQKIQKFSGQISSLEETLIQIKGNAKSGISTLVDQLDELESHFNKSFSHFSARSFACSEELKLLRNRLHHHLAEQNELAKENDVLGIRLRERENVLSEMVRSASEAKKKMAQLEKTLDEKEEEISTRVQEKREAIKQLSDAIIYHKNNSDDLIRYIRNHNRPRLPFCL